MPITKGMLTLQGAALLAKLQSGIPLHITRAVTGAGYVPWDTLKEQTQVTNPRQEMNKGDIYYDGPVAKLPVQISNTGLSQGYAFWQIGVYAKDPDAGEILYTLYQAEPDKADTLLPELEAPGQMFNVNLHIVFGSASKVNVLVDMAGYVTNRMLEAHDTATAAHDNLFPRYELARLEHNLGRYPGVAVLGALQWGAGMGGAGETPAGGSDMDGLPVKVRYHSRQSLSIYTIKAAALPGVAKELHGGGTEWTVTYAGNNRDSLYICLDGGQQGGGAVPPPVMPETIKVSPTMGLKIIKEG